MKYALILFLCFWFHSTFSQIDTAINAQRTDILPESKTDLIFNKINTFHNNTQLAFAFIKNGQTSYYGVKRLNDSIVSINNSQSIFEIGSITKVFTSTLLAYLVEENKITLNDNINDFLPFPMKDDIKITFKSLANHTSGLPRIPSNLAMANPQNPYKGYDEEKLKAYLMEELSLLDTSGMKSQYSNLGAGLLGYTLGVIEDESYSELLQQRIFSPLHMNSSTANRQELNKVIVKGLGPMGQETANWDMEVLSGAGGILSNVEDLSKFALAQFDSSYTALALTRQKTVHVVNNVDIGLGWAIINRAPKNKWYWHNGGTGGYSSSMVIDNKNQNAVIILSNLSAFHPNKGNVDQLSFELMESLEQ
ncbi:serine hydrolase [Echinicola sp. 20G]|uniref:serine hydrolase domain-containing protein n=1 Tax=Echinicola sp. 20G TaxID=2781961 RepID=UPI0019100FC5|nr:serine hydrolase domain-containing protein [Echinicola sp. 20G]